jgi:hypothetical protein
MKTEFFQGNGKNQPAAWAAAAAALCTYTRRPVAGPCPFSVPATVKPKLAQALLLAAVGSRCGVADTAKKRAASGWAAIPAMPPVLASSAGMQMSHAAPVASHVPFTAVHKPPSHDATACTNGMVENNAADGDAHAGPYSPLLHRQTPSSVQMPLSEPPHSKPLASRGHAAQQSIGLYDASVQLH